MGEVWSLVKKINDFKKKVDQTVGSLHRAINWTCLAPLPTAAQTSLSPRLHLCVLHPTLETLTLSDVSKKSQCYLYKVSYSGDAEIFMEMKYTSHFYLRDIKLFQHPTLCFQMWTRSFPKFSYSCIQMVTTVVPKAFSGKKTHLPSQTPIYLQGHLDSSKWPNTKAKLSTSRLDVLVSLWSQVTQPWHVIRCL